MNFLGSSRRAEKGRVSVSGQIGRGDTRLSAWTRFHRGQAAVRPYDVHRFGGRREASDSAVQSGAGGSIVGVDHADEDPVVRRMRTEAVLLVAKTPLNTRKLAQLAHLADGTEARTLVRQLNQIYDDHGRSLRIEQVAGGYRMLTRAAYAPWLARLGHLPPVQRLSTPMMETLAVVAYRQPVSRASVEAVRGVACGELLRQLMERELIRIAGRSEELGRPYLYGTTKRFLQLFGLANANALPPINWDQIVDDSASPEPSTSETPNPDSSPADDVSTSTKEPFVSTAAASVVPEIDAETMSTAILLPDPDPREQATAVVEAVIEDEEDDLYEGDDDFDDDDEEEEGWDDDFGDDDDDDDEDDDDDDEDDDDEWEEVDDDDDDAEDGEEADDAEEGDEELDDDDEWEEDEEWDDDENGDDVADDDEEEDEDWE